MGSTFEIDPLGRLERRFGIRGVAVLAVPPEGAAARAGMRGIQQTADGLLLGDVIAGVDDQKVQDFDDLYNALDQHRAGDTVNVRLRRQGEMLSLPMQVAVVQ